ncbi:hypothetical protein [Citrobacter meridianamericanus]|uniref:hypothetical protein n=1 Tax=Citrobacter meridianamericanus TaxID=2894201 RepID=UPI00351CCC26
MKSYQINQINLITAICSELNRQYPGINVDHRFGKIAEAANIIVTEFGRPYVPASSNMGLEAWLNSDETGSSSLYMAWILSGGVFGHWWGRHQPEPNYPRDPDDFGRCLKMVEAVPEFKGIIYKMNDCGPEWMAVARHWDSWAKLYQENDGRGLYDLMQSAFKADRGE